MTFRQMLKQIKPIYLSNIKKFYNSTIIFKMIFNHELMDLLFESKIYFSALNNRDFEEENISRKYHKSPENAMRDLRVKGLFCSYLADFVHDLENKHEYLTTKQLEALKNLKELACQLASIATESFSQANIWAAEQNMPTVILEHYSDLEPNDKIIDQFK